MTLPEFFYALRGGALTKDGNDNRGRNSKGLCDSPVVAMDSKLRYVLNTLSTKCFVV